jgi:glutaredoxin-like protein NrdH
MKITVYGRPDRVCMKCRATKAWLGRHGIPFRYVNIDTDPASDAFVRELGALEVPVVVWLDGPKGEDGGWWSGYREGELKALADRLAPTGAS